MKQYEWHRLSTVPRRDSVEAMRGTRDGRTDWMAVVLELLPLLSLPLYALAFTLYEGFAFAGWGFSLAAGLGWWRTRHRGAAVAYAVARAVTLFGFVFLAIIALNEYFVSCDNLYCAEDNRVRDLTVLIAAMTPLVGALVMSSVGSAILVGLLGTRSGDPGSAARNR